MCHCSQYLLQEGETPLLVACLSGNIQTIGLLLDKHYTESPTKLPPTDGANNTVLHMIMSGNGSVLKELLKEMKSLGYTTEQLQELVKAMNKVRYWIQMLGIVIEN